MPSWTSTKITNTFSPHRYFWFFFSLHFSLYAEVLEHSNVRCTQNTEQSNIYKQMNVICVGFVLFGGVCFFCFSFCLKNKTEVYLELLEGFGNDFKIPQKQEEQAEEKLPFPTSGLDKAFYSVVLLM